MVYEILNQNDLCTYYDLEQKPGISLKASRHAGDYGYLDAAEVQQKFVDFQDETHTRVTFYVPQIHCASCIWLLENLYKLHGGVKQSQVNFLKKEVYITYENAQLRLSELVRLLATIGYEPKITLNDLSKGKNVPRNRRFTYQIGIAGFCFGNVMLLSLPAYFSMDMLDVQMSQFLGILNIALSLPVLLFSSQPFFQSAWYGIKHRHLNIDVPIALGILALFSRSLFEILSQTGPGYMDSLVGLVFFLLIGKWFQQKTYDTLSFERDYTSYFPISSIRKQGETEESVPVTDLKAGDIILVRNQELIPADAYLLSGEAQIDYSFVTGESVPVAKAEGELLYAGGRQVGQSIRLQLTKAVSQSYLTQLWNQETFQKQEKERLATLADRFGRYFTFGVLLIASAAAGYWLWADASRAVHVFTSVLIIACPCALALATPITLGNALRLMGRRGLYLKHTRVIERMTQLTQVVFDKTGTLTHTGGLEHTVLSPEKRLSQEHEYLLKSLVRHSTHPISQAIYQHLEEVPVHELTAFQEEQGKGIQGELDGQRLRLGSRAWIMGEGPPQRGDTAQGTYFSINDRMVARFQVHHCFRPGLREVVRGLGRFGISLISGDHDTQRAALEQLMGTEVALHFEQSPANKLSFIRDLQRKGHRVLMLGDGLNDAGALQQSEVGIAVSEDVNNFSPACDAILDAKQFQELPYFLRFSRVSLRLVKAAMGLSLLYNVLGLSFAVQGMLSPVVSAILMPISSVSVVVFGLAGTFLADRWLRKQFAASATPGT